MASSVIPKELGINPLYSISGNSSTTFSFERETTHIIVACTYARFKMWVIKVENNNAFAFEVAGSDSSWSISIEGRDVTVTNNTQFGGNISVFSSPY